MQQLNTTISEKLLDNFKCLHFNYRTARKNRTTNLLMDHAAHKLALQHNRVLRLLKLYTTTKLRNEGHPSVHKLLLACGEHLVHNKELLPGVRVQNIFTHACSCAHVTCGFGNTYMRDSSE